MIDRTQFPHIFAPYCIAFETSVGAVVFCGDNDKRRFLVIKYRNGHWEFPRGKKENGESEYQTMRREIREETGIVDMCIMPQFRETMRFYYIAHGMERTERIKDHACIFVCKKAVFYLARSTTFTVQLSHEHQSYVWATYKQAQDLLTFDNAKEILDRAKKHLDHHAL